MQPNARQVSLAIAQRPPSQVEQDRLRTMQTAWKAYGGDLDQPLKVAADQPNDNILANRCGPIVDKGVSFLFGTAVKIEAADEAADEAAALAPAEPAVPGEAPKKPKMPRKKKPSPIQSFIDGFWGDADDQMTMLSNGAHNGAVCGHVFYKLVPAAPGRKYPRLVALDPTLMRVITAPDDCQLVLAYIIEYPAGNGVQKRQVIARIDPDHNAGEYGGQDPNDTWTIANYQRKSGGNGDAPWLPVGEPEEWAYPFPPIFACQNMTNPNEHWGRPDLSKGLIGMNTSLNFVQSNTARIIKFHAHPKTYITGTGAKTISVGVDEMIVFDSPDAHIGNLEMHSDLGSSLRFAEVLRSDMDEESRVPAVALGRLESLPKGNISGVALQLLFQPLLEKTMHKRRLYGRLIREITRAALVMGGLITIEAWEDYNIELHWQNLLPVDDVAAAQTALTLIQVGVSQDTVIQELGYDPDDEAVKQAARDAQKPPAPPPIALPANAAMPPATPVNTTTAGEPLPISPAA